MNGLGVYHCMGVKVCSFDDDGAAEKVMESLRPLSGSILLDESEVEESLDPSEEVESSSFVAAGSVAISSLFGK